MDGKTNFFSPLVSCSTIDDLILRLVDSKTLDDAHQLFPGKHIKLLLSSVMIYKFCEYHGISQDHELWTLSKIICTTDFTERDYIKYETEFKRWLFDDRQIMINELSKAQEELMETLHGDDQVEWEDKETWNQGIREQVQLLEDSKELLKPKHEKCD